MSEDSGGYCEGYDDGYKKGRQEIEAQLAEAQERIDYITAERDALAYDVTRKQAMQAIELFESEYIGQDAVELWDWALTRAMTEDILAADREEGK